MRITHNLRQCNLHTNLQTARIVQVAHLLELLDATPATVSHIYSVKEKSSVAFIKVVNVAYAWVGGWAKGM
jgi:hypothetical protein